MALLAQLKLVSALVSIYNNTTSPSALALSCL